MRIFVIILILAIVGFLVYFIFDGTKFVFKKNKEATYCTLDAMRCPGGSYVGRVPPTCEFAACPTATTSTTTSSSILLEAAVGITESF